MEVVTKKYFLSNTTKITLFNFYSSEELTIRNNGPCQDIEIKTGTSEVGKWTHNFLGIHIFWTVKNAIAEPKKYILKVLFHKCW